MKEIKAVVKDKGKRIKVKGKREEEKSKKRNTLHASRITKRGRKMKFRPEITRVKLNPEQAVLTCNCFERGWTTNFVMSRAFNMTGTHPHTTYCNWEGDPRAQLSGTGASIRDWTPICRADSL
ncbi:MAG: hypothetical protein ABIK26_09125 [Candidatus Omnitrophota bacterium]